MYNAANFFSGVNTQFTAVKAATKKAAKTHPIGSALAVITAVGLTSWAIYSVYYRPSLPQN
jgi:hypothetical protein